MNCYRSEWQGLGDKRTRLTVVTSDQFVERRARTQASLGGGRLGRQPRDG